MSILKKTRVLALLSATILGSALSAQAADLLILHNANHIDVQTGAINHQDIIIDNGRISTLAKGNDHDMSKHAGQNALDASGKWAIPGLWDMHVHFRSPAGLEKENRQLLDHYTAFGISAVRDAGGNLTDLVLGWRDAADQGSMLAPKIFTAGPKLDGPNGTWAGSIPVTNAADVKTAFDHLEALKVDYAKVYESRISREAYLAVLEEAQKRNMIISGHMPYTVMLDEAIERGKDSIEHLYYIAKGTSSREQEITDKLIKGERVGEGGATNIFRLSHDRTLAKSVYRKMATKGMAVTPTLAIGRVLDYPDLMDHKNDPELAYIPQAIIDTYAGRVDRARNRGSEAWQNVTLMDKHFISLIKPMHDAGVMLLAGSDSGPFNSYTYPGISLHNELGRMVEGGLTPLEALQTATINGAKFMHVEQDFGTLEVGKSADILLLNANPLDDIKNTRTIDTFVLRGTIIDAAKRADLYPKLR